jgi:hypothetical protein
MRQTMGEKQMFLTQARSYKTISGSTAGVAMFTTLVERRGILFLLSEPSSQ